MNRKDFGTWGSELSRDDFARALAALGVLARVLRSGQSTRLVLRNLIERQGRRLVWSLPRDPQALSDLLSRVPAGELADAWRFKGAYRGLRLEIRDIPGDLSWLLQELSNPLVAAEISTEQGATRSSRNLSLGEVFSPQSKDPEPDPGTKATGYSARDPESDPEIPEIKAGFSVDDLEVAPQPAPRFLQAQVFDAERDKLLRRSWRAGVLHSIRVRVGLPAEEWIESGVRFPDEELPKDEAEYRLTLVFSEPWLLDHPLIGEISLPRVGNSTFHSFPLWVKADAERVEGRLIVLYRNRILQTALLRGPVARDPDAAERGGIELQIEAVVRPVLSGLGERSPFGAALLLNHDSRAVPRLTRIADDHAEILAAGELQELGEWFDRRLSEVATSRRDFEGGLGAAATVELLRDFATHGSMLYDYLVKDMLGEDRFAGDGPIQILSTRVDAWLPVEFVYDRKAPLPDAPLCPNAAEALRAGRCDDTCPTGKEAAECICPLGFWGMRRVLERHAHDPSFARSLRGVDFALQAEPVAGRETLAVLGDTLLGASQRVGKSCPGSLDEIAQTVEAVTGRPPRRAESWSDWAASISEGEVPLQVLLVHTDRVSEGGLLQKMEIGEDSWLSVANLDESYVRDRPEKRPPLVLLLGCETGAPEISFLGFVGKFRRSGAAIVLSTGSTVHSVHAVPVAKRYLEVLARLIREGGATTFGEVMRTARRELLADGYPMVLCLAAYGDADWRLTG